jgi:hypothetical protein
MEQIRDDRLAGTISSTHREKNGVGVDQIKKTPGLD